MRPFQGIESVAVSAVFFFAASGSACAAPASRPSAPACRLVESGFGPRGADEIRVETMAAGLEVPWGLAFLPQGGMLVTERPGRVRLVREGRLNTKPVVEIEVASEAEGGLLDIALHPAFATSSLFYLYYTARTADGPRNRVVRYRLSPDRESATLDRVIIDDIPAAQFHDGGRLRFGPDGMLYVGTGDARVPEYAQDRERRAGKILRLTPEGAVPADNPRAGNPVFVMGLRNTQGFDWLPDGTLAVADHGPSGEFGLFGHDEVSVAEAGDNLGWPLVYGCGEREELVAPLITWRRALPPGGLVRVESGPWSGSLVLASLGGRQLHRLVLAGSPPRVSKHEVYLQGDPPAGYGRLRTILNGPDGLYVTTSNCDGRGDCPSERDRILRVTVQRRTP